MRNLNRDKLHVLIVDDEEVVRENLSKSKCFPRTGYRVVASASDGKAALVMAQQLKPDLILADINMPVMDGLSMIQKLRDEKDSTEVLILSCYDDFQYAQQAIQLGVSSYLLKPFTDEELIQALEQVKQKLEKNSWDRKMQEMEQFLLRGKEHVLHYLLQQAIVRGGREEIIHNIYHMGLMKNHALYALVFFKGFPKKCREQVDELLAGNPQGYHLLDTTEQDFLILLAADYVSANRFQCEVRQTMKRSTQRLVDFPGIVVQSEIFIGLERAHEQFLHILAKAKQMEAKRERAVKERPKSRPEIEQAIIYIKNHLCEDGLCLNAVAKSIPISPFYFSRLFTQEMGMSFVRYVNVCRVEKACSMLEKSDLRIYEISKAAGFQNETYFHQVFKAIKGMTPKRYQKECVVRYKDPII